MDSARIAGLLEPFLAPTTDQALTTDDLEHISTYIEMLRRWNARINLTGISDPVEIVTRHFGESLFAAYHLFPDRRHPREGQWPIDQALIETGALASEGVGVRRSLLTSPDRSEANYKHLNVADLGSGAGFPGLPIKLWAPQICLTLIESNRKKAIFLREIVRALTLSDVKVESTRADSIAGHAFDLVTLRAVERFRSILSVAANLVVPGGRLALLIGSAQAAEAQSALPHFVWANPLAIPASRSRILAVASRSG